MAYVITAVGAGGKTSCLAARGMEYLSCGKTVAFTTTTHIWNPGREKDGILYFGTEGTDGKLGFPGPEIYEKLCRDFDVVLVEGDGSHRMPVKIPNDSEPVVPENTDEILVVMGKHAVGRELGTVCHRYFKMPEERRPGRAEEIVTEQFLRTTAEKFYIQPLSIRFPDAKISYVLSDMTESGFDHDIRKITFVLLASGFGKRFGKNKLTEPYRGEKLYRHMLLKLVSASAHIGKETEVLVVTQYEQIMDEVNNDGIRSLRAVRNPEAAEGIAASVRIGTGEAEKNGADAVIFFAADMPDLPEKDICRFTKQFLFSGKTYACMEAIDEASGAGTPVNPGAFRFRDGVAENLLFLSGDRGAMRIIKGHLPECHVYQIEKEKVRDIDLREDMESRM